MAEFMMEQRGKRSKRAERSLADAEPKARDAAPAGFRPI